MLAEVQPRVNLYRMAAARLADALGWRIARKFKARAVFMLQRIPSQPQPGASNHRFWLQQPNLCACGVKAEYHSVRTTLVNNLWPAFTTT